jgi:hypothetical protein
MNRYISGDLYFYSVDKLIYLWEQRHKKILKKQGDLNAYGNFVTRYGMFLEQYLLLEFQLVLNFNKEDWITCLEILIDSPDDIFLILSRYFTVDQKWLDPLDRKIASGYLEKLIT